MFKKLELSICKNTLKNSRYTYETVVFKFHKNSHLLNFQKTNTFNINLISGHSSVVERLVANEKVEGSTPFARSKKHE